MLRDFFLGPLQTPVTDGTARTCHISVRFLLEFSFPQLASQPTLTVHSDALKCLHSNLIVSKWNQLTAMLSSFLPPIGCCDSAYCFARRATPCWASDVSPDVRCTCSASPNVPTRRRNAIPALRVIIECRKLDRSCDLLLTLDRCGLAFWGRFLDEAKKNVDFYSPIKFFCVAPTTNSIINFSLIFRPLNMISAQRMTQKNNWCIFNGNKRDCFTVALPSLPARQTEKRSQCAEWLKLKHIELSKQFFLL